VSCAADAEHAPVLDDLILNSIPSENPLRTGQPTPTLVDVFRFAVSLARALCRVALTAASALLSSALLSSALLSSAGLPVLDGARR
jgi:hypothetical protein